jgi:magnesium chelatase family protein
VAARVTQQARGVLNRDLSRQRLDDLPWDPEAGTLLVAAVDRLALSGRGWDRVRRVARTIADLQGAEAVAGDHVAEALALRAAT